MKLSHVLEARYAFPKYVQWAEDSIRKRGEHELYVPRVDSKVAVRQLTDRFGKPYHQTFPDDEPERQYYMWQNDPEEEMISFNLVYYPYLESMLVQTFRDVPVNEARTAQNSIFDEIKAAMIDRNPWEQMIEGIPYSQIVNMITQEFGPPAWEHDVEGGLYKTTWRINREELTAVKYPDNFTEVYLV